MEDAAKIGTSQTPEETGIDVENGIDLGADLDEGIKVNVTKIVAGRMKQVKDKLIADEVAPRDLRIKDLEGEIARYQRAELEKEAEERGITADELEQERKAAEDDELQKVLNHPEFKRMQERDLEITKRQILKDLQGEFPDEGIKDLDSIDKEFFQQLRAGKDHISAYKAYMRLREEPPKSTGTAKSNGEVEKRDYLTEDEIAKLTKEDYLRDPKLLEKAKRGMRRK
jgi:hypothetical protein